MGQIYGNVHKIIKFSAVDGPGNRCAVFFQGCNFNCVFCHNPETISFQSEDAKLMTAEDVFQEIGSAVNFIRGITVSGGEATCQRNFLIELFRLAHEKNLSAFIDSNGSYDFSKDPELMAVTDKVMLDVKSMDNEEHIQVTGVPNTMVLKNLEYLAENNKLFEIRTVCSPNLIDCERTVKAAAEIIGRYNNIRYKLIKYRPNGVRSEYIKLYKVANKDFMENLKDIASEKGVKDIVII